MVNTGDVYSPKRIKLDPSSEPLLSDTTKEEPDNHGPDTVDGEDENGESCSICLSNLEDRTVIPTCSHEFCFECLVVWTGNVNRPSEPLRNL
jgi:Zinc finger, C3HC4 type (RING finger)